MDLPWWPSGKVPASKPDFAEDPKCLCAWCMLNLEWVKRPLAGVVRTFGEGLPAQEPRSGDLSRNFRETSRLVGNLYKPEMPKPVVLFGVYIVV
ncbi:hypothetical protein AVEN_27776-1 [Araneus ventricosus]|uniref:Uncharacterized protein n=1 Tax=Araneus ventricosus TaxID=182803 RepID=A0A4Y2JFH9_ARAVE|nr:hypothetical protein AVEN_27776-1 [Araneus ventricosus]